jgi:hypothetical protein
VAIPAVIGLVGLAHFANLLDIRTQFRTAYNDIFAIPMAAMLVILALADGVMALRGDPAAAGAADAEPESGLLSAKEIGFAFLVAFYMAGMVVSFAVATIVFLLVAPILISLPPALGAMRSALAWRANMPLWWIVTLVVFVALNYALFVLLMEVPLP